MEICVFLAWCGLVLGASHHLSPEPSLTVTSVNRCAVTTDREMAPEGKRGDELNTMGDEVPVKKLTELLQKAMDFLNLGVISRDLEHTIAELERKVDFNMAKLREKDENQKSQQPEEELQVQLGREFAALRILTRYNKAMAFMSLICITACAMFIAYFTDEGISWLVMCAVTVTFISAGIIGFLFGAVWRLEQAVISNQNRSSDCVTAVLRSSRPI